MIQIFFLWIERYLFAPKGIDYLISLLLLPISLLYTLILFFRFFFTKPKDFGLPIISIGNLVIGGSGKTPVTISLALNFKNVSIVLRGYKRKSTGTIVVCNNGKILENSSRSGDEAMLLAQSLPKCTVIVATNRAEGILKAKELNAKIVFLDDGYSKHHIKKLDIILEPIIKKYLPFCLPSGPYREKIWWGKKVSIFTEEKDFKRIVKLENPTKRMLLVTAISKPWRLDPYLPKVVAKKNFIDHYQFKKEELIQLMEKYNATSIVTTQKDAIKMQTFGLNLSILNLSLNINNTMKQLVKDYVKDFNENRVN